MSLLLNQSIDNTPTHSYLNIQITNNSQTDLNPQPVNFQDIRSSSFLQKPNDYYMSIIRFSLDSPSLPVFIPQIEIGQPDRNKTIYTWTMTCLSGSTVLISQSNVMWETQDKSIPLPAQPTTQQEDSPYYYCNSYQHFYKKINDCLASCLAGLTSQIVDPSSSKLTAKAPFFQFDVNNQTAILNCEVTQYLNTLPNPIKIYCNGPMWNLISSFEAIQYNLSQGREYELTIRNIDGTNILQIVNPIVTPPSPPTVLYIAVQSYQEYSTTALWNPVKSIVFTSTLLPIEPTQIATPLVFNSNVGFTTPSNNNNNFSVILTDMVADTTDKGSGYKPMVLYNPQSEFRLIDLNGTAPVNSVDIQIFWLDRFNILHKFFLWSGGSANLKLMFRKKNFNRGY